MSLELVAKHAGVSTATVCRVLRRESLVKPETAVQVREAMRAIGYVPPPARSRYRRRGSIGESNGPAPVATRRIAIITVGDSYREWMQESVIGSFVAAVTTAGREREIDVMLDEMPTATELSSLVRRREIHGAILLVQSTFARTRECVPTLKRIAAQLPAVWAMGSQSGTPVIDHVTTDNVGVGQVAADHLLGQGCRKCAFVTNTTNWPFVRMRAAGFVSSLYDAGVPCDTYLVTADPAAADVFSGRVKVVGSMAEAAAAMAASDVRPDGLFAATDGQLAQLFPHLSPVGLQVGQNLQAIGCDNSRSSLSTLSVQPATIDLNTPEIATRAIQRLLVQMKHLNESPIQVHVAPRLIEPQPAAAR